MPLTLRNLCNLAIATAGLILSNASVCAQEARTLQVLILNSYDESTAPYFRPKDVFMSELQKVNSLPIAYRQFDLGHRGANDRGREELNAQLLKNEYLSAQPDLVVAVGPPATAFWLNHRGPGFSDIPFIGVGADIALAGMKFGPGDAAVVTPFSFSDAIEDLLFLLPDTRHIVMVFGSSSHEQMLSDTAKQQLKNAYFHINFEYTNDSKLTALQNNLAGLQAGSAVFYAIFDSDVDGVLLNSYSGLTLVRSSSSVPVFGAFDDQLGLGIVGGRLIQLEKMGKEIAVTAQELLSGGPPDLAWNLVDLGAPTYDWKELQVWGIRPEQLPAGSVIQFKPKTVWELYAGWILLMVFVITVLSLLITALWLQNRQRQRAELASRRLGRRLISAQEDERRYIARELHDDLSQRLARVAIDASYVVSTRDHDAANEILQNLHPELVSISKDVHDMSYRLHPSIIDDLGLVAALQSECEKVRRYSDAEIIEQFGDIGEHIPSDVALCVYRIAQEAINNAVKYASAENIEIMLERSQHKLLLTVRDDGDGFIITQHAEQSGLGLSSMYERAQLVGGSWKIQSQPGEGTTVSAIVPLGGVEI